MPDPIENPYVAQRDNTRVHVPNPNIEVDKEQPWVDHFGNPNGTIYDPLVGNNPNNQWISGASNQTNASPEQKQSSQDYAQNFIGAVTPIPALEGIKLTARGARIPGLIDDAILKPILSGAKSIKSFISPKFVSDVDWAKWNKAIPENKELLDEYHLIEQTAKKNKTWMKNPDGSDFVGSPEQFIQVNSGNFKTAYPEGYESVWRGVSHAEEGVLRSKRGPYGEDVHIKDRRKDMTGMFTADKNVANTYSGRYTTEGVESEHQLYNLAMKKSSNSLKIEGLGNTWMDLNTIGISKKLLKRNIDHLETSVIKGTKPQYHGGYDAAAALKSYKKFYKNYDEIVNNSTYKKLLKHKKDLKNMGHDLYTSDDLARFVEMHNLDNVQIKYLDDAMFGDINISNQIPGNYLKSLEGNVGTFDLTNPSVYKKHGGPVSEYTDGTNVSAQIQPLTSFQSQETPYQDLNWLQKANYGFSEGMYNQPVIAGSAPGGGIFGKLDKTWTGIKKGVDLAESYVPKTVSSDAAFNASNNQINLNAERTGTATTHGSQGVGNGMYMEAPTFQDGAKVENTEIDWDKLYESITRREHRGYYGKEGYSPFIRTKGTKGQRGGTSKGSTAYGPIQITGDRLKDLNTPGRRQNYWDDPTQDYPEQGGVSWDQEYVDELLEQSRLFNKYGGSDMPEKGVDTTTNEDVSRYGYGREGDLNSEENQKKYKDLGIVLLKGTRNLLKSELDREPTTEELIKHWRGGDVDEEPDYVTDVLTYYNTKEEPVGEIKQSEYGPTPSGELEKIDLSEEGNYKQGGTVYAKDNKETSRYLKSYKKFNDGGKVGKTREDKFTGWVKNRKVHLPEGISPHVDPEMLYKDQYNTELVDEEYRDFLLWATNWTNPNSGKKVNMMDEGAYDVRGFWKSGDWKKTDGRGHGSDMWKKPNHPTFSDESVYSKQKGGSEFDGGTWMDNGAFVPGFHNMHTNDRLLHDFNDEGPEHLIGSYVLPEVEVTP